MLAGKVIGHVWSAKKLEGLPPGALLRIELECGSERGSQQIIAFDPLGCGEGERVLVVTGSVAARFNGQRDKLIDALVIASLDEENS